MTEWDSLGLEPIAESKPVSEPDSGDASGAGSSDDEGMGSLSSAESVLHKVLYIGGVGHRLQYARQPLPVTEGEESNQE